MERQDPGSLSKAARTPVPRRTFQVAAVILAAIAGLVVIACWRVPEDDAAGRKEGHEAPTAKAAFDRLFGKWGKPDLALLLSAQQHGYLQPCGCSHPQYGGLTRRYNFLQLLKANGWPVVAMDLGDIPQEKGMQKMLKYTASMKALDKMNYAAVGLGQYEMSSLLDTLAHYHLNNLAPPALASNLHDKDKGQTFDGLVKSGTVVDTQGKLKVGIIGAVGPSVESKVKDPDVKFDKVPKVLPLLLKQIQAQKPNFLVLLYQGSLMEAKACARFIPQFDVIVCLSAEEEPPSVPDQVGKTSIVTLGHKGRYVGVMGIYRTGKADKPFNLRYQLVALGEEFETPKGKEKGHPVMELMEEYARDVKRNGFLAQAAIQKTPHQIQFAENFPKSVYVGSDKCKKCHESVYETWEKSPHSNAYVTLAGAKNPSLRQYDSECIKCHVTGWEHNSGFMDEKKTPFLKNNGCENCHGPCSEHVKDPNNQRIKDLINPYRYNPDENAAQRARRISLIDQSCQKCHDIDNDVSWKIEKWWTGKIVHSDDELKPAKKAK